MTTQTPLDPSTPAPATRPPRRTAAVAVSIVTIVVGSVAFLGTVGGTAISAAATLSDSGYRGLDAQVSTRGLTGLDLDLAAGSLTIAYGDVTDAELAARVGGPGGWTFERRGDTLRVASPDRGVLSTWGSGGHSATLTLPRELARTDLDAKLEVTGGSLDLDAAFGDLRVELAGGEVTLAGGARSLNLTVAGGSASTELEDVDTAAFEVAGGDLSVDLSGTTPSRTTVSVTGGSADIVLPDDTYRVSTEGVGSVDNSLRTSSSATAVVQVEAALGHVSLSS
ncbi:MAG: hypothetical protein K0S37_1423 [Microbacterium sp.]|jgi:hypothetical protein|nr:hypothetical protein [Microbacterium sp.]